MAYGVQAANQLPTPHRDARVTWHDVKRYSEPTAPAHARDGPRWSMGPAPRPAPCGSAAAPGPPAAGARGALARGWSGVGAARPSAPPPAFGEGAEGGGAWACQLLSRPTPAPGG